MALPTGFRVREYASGAQLLEAADGLDGGCALLDLNMPEADGSAVHKALKDRSIDVPVILMTGTGDLAVSPLRADVAGLIQKPFRRTELKSLLDQLCPESPAGTNAP